MAPTYPRGVHQPAELITGFEESSGISLGEAVVERWRRESYRIRNDSAEVPANLHLASFFRRFLLVTLGTCHPLHPLIV